MLTWYYSDPSVNGFEFMSLPSTPWTLKRTWFFISILTRTLTKRLWSCAELLLTFIPARSRDSNEKVWQQSVRISCNEAEKDLRTPRPLWAPGQSPVVVCQEGAGKSRLEGWRGLGGPSPAVPTSEKFFVSSSVWLGNTSVGLAHGALGTVSSERLIFLIIFLILHPHIFEVGVSKTRQEVPLSSGSTLLRQEEDETLWLFWIPGKKFIVLTA